MYQDFSAKKLFFALIIATILFGGALTTVFLTKSRFGNISVDTFKLEGSRYLDMFKYYFDVRKLAKGFGIIPSIQSIEFTDAIPVLLYHGVVETPNGINVSWSDFKEQMFTLKQAGWQTVSLADFYLFMRGEKKLPEKSFLLTFDDGRKDSFYNADPILKVLEYKATMFVITKYSINNKVESKFYLPKEELRQMIESGRWEVQSHSRDAHDFYVIDKNGNKGHFLGNKLWLDSKNRLETNEEFHYRIQNDLLLSRQDIENRLHTDVISFAFPFGDFGQNTHDNHLTENLVVREALAVYPLVFYQYMPNKGDPLNYPDPKSSSFMIKRIEVDSGLGINGLLQKLTSYHPKVLPVHKEEFGQEWADWWGSTNAGKTLVLKTNAKEKSTATFLVGSALFKDYDFLTKVNYQTGSTISLILRFKDGDNYLSCNFRDGLVFAEERLAGQNKEIASNEHNLILPDNDLWLGARVNGNTLDCLVGDRVVIEKISTNPKLEAGGVGFKLWHPGPEPVALVIEEIVVTEPNKDSTLVSLPSYPLAPSDKESEKGNVETTDIHIANTDDAVESSADIVPAKEKPVLVPFEILGTSFPDIWQSIYGKIFTQDNVLHIGAEDPNRASLAILQGSESWSNYKMTTTIDWFRGESLGLVARYRDSENYISCEYSTYGTNVGLYQMSGGKSVLLGRSPSLPIPYTEPWRNLSFAVKVNSDTIDCLVGDDVILHYSIAGVPQNGGIGFETWDKDKGNTDIAVKRIIVEEVK